MAEYLMTDLEVGDRFASTTGVEWVVLANDGVSLTVVSPGLPPYTSHLPDGATVDVLNRDDTLTDVGSIDNLMSGGLDPTVIAVIDEWKDEAW